MEIGNDCMKMVVKNETTISKVKSKTVLGQTVPVNVLCIGVALRILAVDFLTFLSSS
jgi:hypothetical protein